MACAYVKFCMDGHRATVPLSFIKDFDKRDFFPGIKYPVFWSSKKNETPEDVKLAQGGIVLEVEKEPETSKGSAKKPVPGYYQAEILEVAETKAELNTSKRVPVSSLKAAESNEMKRKKPSSKEKRSSKAADKKTIQKGENNTFEKLKRKASSKKTSSKRTNKSSDSSSSSDLDEDEVLTPRKNYVKRINDLKAEAEKYRTKYHNLVEKNVHEREESQKEMKGLRELNINLQNQLLKKNVTSAKKKLYEDENYQHSSLIGTTISSHDSAPQHFTPDKRSRTPRETRTSNNPFSPDRRSVTPLKSPFSPDKRSVTPVKSPFSSDKRRVTPRKTQTPKNPFSPDKSVTPAKNRFSPNKRSRTPLIPNSPFSPNKVDITPSKETPSKFQRQCMPNKRCKTDSETSKERNLSKPKYFLTPEGTKRVVYWKVKNGEAGDSQYTKNLAQAIFGVDILMKSSVDGQPYPGNKDPTPRPALDDTKMKQIKDLFHERMLSEHPKVTKEEMKRRAAEIKDYLADKIQTLRRPSRKPKNKDAEQGKEKDGAKDTS